MEKRLVLFKLLLGLGIKSELSGFFLFGFFDPLEDAIFVFYERGNPNTLRAVVELLCNGLEKIGVRNADDPVLMPDLQPLSNSTHVELHVSDGNRTRSIVSGRCYVSLGKTEFQCVVGDTNTVRSICPHLIQYVSWRFGLTSSVAPSSRP